MEDVAPRVALDCAFPTLDSLIFNEAIHILPVS